MTILCKHNRLELLKFLFIFVLRIYHLKLDIKTKFAYFLFWTCILLPVSIGFAWAAHPVETSVVIVLTLPPNAMRPFPPI